MSHSPANRVLIVVHTLIGSGHLQRMARLSRALTDLGVEVDLVSGGRPEPLLDVSPANLIQLPPLVAANGNFADLVDSLGRPVTKALQNRRQLLHLSFLNRFQPRILVVEMFPFGRRKLRFELLPLLRVAAQSNPRPVIICSVRDVLQGGRPLKHVEEMADIINQYFDYVLVHGDPRSIRFEETFLKTDEISDKLKYTGFIIRRPPYPEPTDSPGQDEVIVSAGGGTVGAKLFQVALQAAKQSSLKGNQWRFLVGNAVAENNYSAMVREAGKALIVERVRGDFYWLLKNCALSISQGGYNTLLEILQTGAKAVIVPFTGQGETEQTFRASKLRASGRIEMVMEEALSVNTLLQAIEKAMTKPIGQLPLPDMRGAENSARLIQGWLAP